MCILLSEKSVGFIILHGDARHPGRLLNGITAPVHGRYLYILDDNADIGFHGFIFSAGVLLYYNRRTLGIQIRVFDQYT